MPSFNFFKKKDKDISKLSNKKSGAVKFNNTDRPSPRQ